MSLIPRQARDDGFFWWTILGGRAANLLAELWVWDDNESGDGNPHSQITAAWGLARTMRTFRHWILGLLLVVMLSARADDAAKDPNELGTIVTAVKTYQHVHLNEVTDLGIKCSWDGGLGLIPFDSLSPDLQKRFNYDPAKFKQAADDQNARDGQSDAMAVQATKQLKAQEDYQKNSVAVVQAKPNAPVRQIKYLVGHVVQTLDVGYVVRLEDMSTFAVAVARKYPYPMLGYSSTVILKAHETLVDGQTVKVPVFDVGSFKSSEGRQYGMFEEWMER